jgi:hypothetical protein
MIFEEEQPVPSGLWRRVNLRTESLEACNWTYHAVWLDFVVSSLIRSLNSPCVPHRFFGVGISRFTLGGAMPFPDLLERSAQSFTKVEASVAQSCINQVGNV